ncbi:hypothetical protein ACFQQB_28995 [Nonomuraea rubra]|uniref:hypothetical protein n=1 Tax=Nonomuraea rubra TaxID=46180 RepID=UPI0036077D37
MALILGPVVMCAGYLLRHLSTVTALTPQQQAWAEAQPFAAYGQLLAYSSEPALLTLSYAVFALGAILLFPAFVALAQRVGGGLAFWGPLCWSPGSSPACTSPAPTRPPSSSRRSWGWSRRRTRS